MCSAVYGDSDGRKAKYRKVCETIEALSAKDARCLGKIEEQIGWALRSWPDDVRTKMLCSRLDYKGRFSLYLFVAGNVCPPELFVDWVIQRKMLRYSESALHLANVVKSHMTGKLEQDNKTYWDLATREVRTIITPTFASEVDPSYTCNVNGDGVEEMPPGCLFWEHAIKKLEAHACTLPREP